MGQLITICGDQMVSGRAKWLLAATANVMVSNVGWRHHLSGKDRDWALSSVTDVLFAVTTGTATTSFSLPGLRGQTGYLVASGVETHPPLEAMVANSE